MASVSPLRVIRFSVLLRLTCVIDGQFGAMMQVSLTNDVSSAYSEGGLQGQSSDADEVWIWSV